MLKLNLLVQDKWRKWSEKDVIFHKKWFTSCHEENLFSLYSEKLLELLLCMNGGTHRSNSSRMGPNYPIMFLRAISNRKCCSSTKKRHQVIIQIFYFIEIGMTFIWPTFGDLPKSNFFTVPVRNCERFVIWFSVAVTDKHTMEQI